MVEWWLGVVISVWIMVTELGKLMLVLAYRPAIQKLKKTVDEDAKKEGQAIPQA
jgi:hypothetical protein